VEIAQQAADKQGKSLRVMFEDEARFGRMNRPVRCWAPKGCRPITGKQLVREYTYVFCAVSPKDGGTDFLILPSLDQQTTGLFLQEVAHRYSDEFILMIYDGASAHSDVNMSTPENMIIAYLPPYSPELNPVEHIWDDMREKFFGNIVFDTMQGVEDNLVDACKFYEACPNITQPLTGFDWIVNVL
jgi:DDE superfamily endonuclease